MPALSLGWFGKGSEGDALASDLPRSADRSFDIAFIGPEFGFYITVQVCVMVSCCASRIN